MSDLLHVLQMFGWVVIIGALLGVAIGALMAD